MSSTPSSHQLGGVHVTGRRDGAGVQRDESFEDVAPMLIGLVATSFDLGRGGCSMRHGRFGAGQGDSMHAGVDLGAAK